MTCRAYQPTIWNSTAVPKRLFIISRSWHISSLISYFGRWFFVAHTKQMQGDGELQQWLHETGKDIGKMVGTHLKKAAKDKAVSYAQEQLGLGLADELGMAAKTVAKKSAAHALTQASSSSRPWKFFSHHA